MKKRFFDILWALLHPNFWAMNNGYNSAVDQALLDQMSRYNFKRIDSEHSVKLGNNIWWVSNYPYAAFTFKNARPARRTIAIAYHKMVHDLLLCETKEAK